MIKLNKSDFVYLFYSYIVRRFILTSILFDNFIYICTHSAYSFHDINLFTNILIITSNVKLENFYLKLVLSTMQCHFCNLKFYLILNLTLIKTREIENHLTQNATKNTHFISRKHLIPLRMACWIILVLCNNLSQISRPCWGFRSISSLLSFG